MNNYNKLKILANFLRKKKESIYKLFKFKIFFGKNVDEQFNGNITTQSTNYGTTEITLYSIWKCERYIFANKKKIGISLLVILIDPFLFLALNCHNRFSLVVESPSSLYIHIYESLSSNCHVTV